MIDTSMYQNFQGGTGGQALAQGLSSGLEIANRANQMKLQEEEARQRTFANQQAKAVGDLQIQAAKQDQANKMANSYINWLGSQPEQARANIHQKAGGPVVSQFAQAYGLPMEAMQISDFSNQGLGKIKNMFLDNREQLEQMWKQKNFDQKEREIAAAKESEKNKFKELPKDKQVVVDKLAGANATKISIKNQIDAVLGQWDGLTEEQKLQQGRQLVKVLNSTQGQDAVGVEEANRLASKLEFATGNFFNNNPIQFGRDIDGFRDDAKITSEGLEAAVKANQDVIDQNYGRQTAKKVVNRQINQKTGQARLVYDDGSTEIVNEKVAGK